MNRRRFFQYGALSSASFLIHPRLKNFGKMIHKTSYEWIVLYWMPYDNDLSRFGDPIIQMLSQGVQSENILVLVEADFKKAQKLSRYVINQGKIKSQKLETANSGSEEVFAEYINWVKSQYTAEKWAIVFLGHGGRLDEISPDESPEAGVNLPTKWMNINKLSEILTNFNQELNNRLELVFLQNCNKGTVEVHYTFRHAAKYTLSSQLILGAPNYYYKSLFEYLGRYPEIHGGQLAEKIMEFEQKDMYHSYTVTNNFAVRNLPAKINPLIDEILKSNISNVKIGELQAYGYRGDRFVDVIKFFEKITVKSSVNSVKYREFIDFLTTSIIHKVQQQGTLLEDIPEYQNLSGLGLFLPRSKQDIEKYQYLSVFSDLKLIELFDKILFD